MACYVVDMRVLILLMILSLGFSGFSTAAHAVESSHCGSAASFEAHDSSATMLDDCADNGKETAQKDKCSESNEQKHACVSCGHCCVSHFALTAFGVSVDLPAIKSTFTIVDSDVDNDFISTLKRPPKSLV